MGLFDSIKRNLNIGGPKITGPTTWREVLEISPTDPSLDIPFTITNQDTPLHVDRIRLQILVPAQSNRGTGVTLGGNTGSDSTTRVFYKETVHDNNGAGWDLAPQQALELNLPVTLNHPADSSNIANFVRDRRPAWSPKIGRHWEITVQIIADLPNVLVDPQRSVSIYIIPDTDPGDDN